jgi:hypothetical protein
LWVHPIIFTLEGVFNFNNIGKIIIGSIGEVYIISTTMGTTNL